MISERGLAGQVDAARLAERFAESATGGGSVAERAAGDPDWEFGHVIVDEAQELSPMAWRMLARRCPDRSMTVVGDLAQASAPWGATDWETVLDPIALAARGSVAHGELPHAGEVMAVAADVLAAVDASPFGRRLGPRRGSPAVLTPGPDRRHDRRHGGGGGGAGLGRP